MKKLTFTIGTQDKDNRDIFYSINNLKSTLASRLNYATFTAPVGCYKYNDGTVCFEPSLKVEVILSDDGDFKKQVEICKAIENACNLFNQESYLYEIQTSNIYNATLIYC
jgi:hypothetical protein